MARLLVVVVVIASVIPLAHSACYPLIAEVGFDETGKLTEAFCKLEDGTKKKDGESWTDEIKCYQCTCGGSCCGFGFAMAGVMHIEKDGERCKAVRTGGCMEFKYVKESDPSVVCLAPSPRPPPSLP